MRESRQTYGRQIAACLLLFMVMFLLVMGAGFYKVRAAQAGEESQSEQSLQPESAAESESGTAAEPETEEEKIPDGLVKADNGRLYFYKNGKTVKKALQEVGNKLYYFGSSGEALTDAWKKFGSYKYYFGADGMAYTGSRKIGSRYYVFKADGKLATGDGKHIVKYENKRYFVNKKGAAVSGWQIYKNKVVYASESGRMAVNKKVSYIRFDSKGYAKNRYQAMAKIYAADFIKKHTDNSMSRRKKLRTCFYYMLKHRRYIAHYVSDKKAFKTNTWEYKAACDMLCDNRLEGNCRNFAAAFAAIAKELGYKPYVWNMKTHSVVKIDGKYYDSLRGYGMFGGGRLSTYTKGRSFKF